MTFSVVANLKSSTEYQYVKHLHERSVSLEQSISSAARKATLSDFEVGFTLNVHIPKMWNK